MTDPLVLDPPSAIAAARCLIARQWVNPTLANIQADAIHPRPCAWEDWSNRDLAAMLDDFNRAAYGYQPHPAVDRFRRLTVPEQREMIRRAQYPMEVPA